MNMKQVFIFSVFAINFSLFSQTDTSPTKLPALEKENAGRRLIEHARKRLGKEWQNASLVGTRKNGDCTETWECATKDIHLGRLFVSREGERDYPVAPELYKSISSSVEKVLKGFFDEKEVGLILTNLKKCSSGGGQILAIKDYVVGIAFSGSKKGHIACVILFDFKGIGNSPECIHYTKWYDAIKKSEGVFHKTSNEDSTPKKE